MKNATKWVFTHEPAILAGLLAGVAVFLSIRYGTHASAVVQAQGGGLVALAFSTLRNFVTSPAGRKAIDEAQAGVAQLPALTSDVNTMWSTLAPAMNHPAGLLGLIESHAGELKASGEDALSRLRGVAPPVTTEGAPVTVTAEVSAPVAPEAPVVPDPVVEPDPMTELGKLIGT